jgi:hypothetical protein
MNKLKKVIALAGIAVMCLSAHDLMAQAGGGGGGGGFGGGRRNFDPAQFRQQMLDSLKDAMEVTNDDEWNVLQAAIGKVMDANQEVQSSTPRGFGRGGRNRNGGGNAGGGTNNAGGGNGGGNAGGRRGGPTPSPEVEALSSAIEANASADEIKGKLAAVRSALEAKQSKLVAAQADLQKLVSTKQEAILVLRGILK